MKQNENHIEIKFFDFDIKHKEISKILELEPTNKWNKGDEYKIGPKSKETAKLRKENYWGYDVVTETNDYIGNQVDDFITSIVIPRKDKIRDLTEKFGGEFSIVQYMYDGYNPGFFLDKKQIEMLSDCGLGLNVDIYVLSETEEDKN